MLDIGWTELLVIAVVLIIVVGPKDLPPMLRAFGKMATRLRKTAGDFRAQFDEALREADLDDVRKTIDDVHRLNPANTLRDAINPLRQMGNDIKADLQKAASPTAFPVDTGDKVASATTPAQPMTEADLPPLASLPTEAPAALAAAGPAAAMVSAPAAKPARKPRVAKAASKEVALAAPASETALVTTPARSETALVAKPRASKKALVAGPPAVETAVVVVPDAAKKTRAPNAKKTAARKKTPAAEKKDKA